MTCTEAGVLDRALAVAPRPTRPLASTIPINKGRAGARTCLTFCIPKEFELPSCSVPSPTVREPRARPGDTGKADCSIEREFAEPLGSGSHSFWEGATGRAGCLTQNLLATSAQVRCRPRHGAVAQALGSQRRKWVPKAQPGGWEWCPRQTCSRTLARRGESRKVVNRSRVDWLGHPRADG